MLEEKVKDMNITALAYIGDAVYEVNIRGYLINQDPEHIDAVHKKAVNYVSAQGQALAIKNLMKESLTEEEIKLVKRARNHRVTSKAKNADAMEYKYATAFEALIGALYLSGDNERLADVIMDAITVIEKNLAKEKAN